ncbi:uncharacterized protein CTRU02_214293 [Colletotrichum truncatum]|uniref:Uncharacterized protein n=1 Tax=Colletotrichum truncatum TaxID=5467 RepID=A0ACC3YI63_COLTU|nr:uncharacterized protein CTRU02_15880 [Colletotrichum truncatum]XP_036578772.1 uncharacterized protein CTRU02_11363 [Colletotrichum truncatum]KAF6780546.1 hypothetical protein CTRU02_15880 [Colletotrichum truncatum]KAF6786105.1 hypothetical protein CTRU02_11363 [Colletotrichum truncatum]
MVPDKYPSFRDLPLDKKGPHGNAWGLWGLDDQLGTLNLLTDDVVACAARENIINGQRVSLNWSMTGASYPKFARKLLELNTINKAPLKHAHDDEWSFNSQCSSQWDGFRHYAYQDEALKPHVPMQLYYMGRTAKDFAESSVPNGIQHVSSKGIAGRAVFIDWYAWAQKRGLDVDAFTSYEVPFSQLIDALNDQGISKDVFRPGDIIIIRFGYLSQYESMSNEKRDKLNELYKTKKPDNIGIKPSRELLEFLWDNKIAAICGDTRSLEVWPCRDTEWHMHEWLLAGWGMPIGELFYLEDVSRLCSSLSRYIFFLSSSPMNVPGAVASPPNALAFF